MDIFDKAQLLEAATRQRLIDDVRALVPRGRQTSECERCGDGIAVARQQALPGVQTCIACARKNEQARGAFKGR